MRCFIEIDIPESIKATLSDVANRINKETPESSGFLSITKKENLHVTLAFLGEIDENNIDGIIKTASGIAKKFSEFKCTISKIEAVPEKYPRMIWASLDENKALSGLYKELSRALLPESKKENDFAAHITLVRIKNGADIKARQEITKSTEHVNIAPLNFPVRELKLMQSHETRCEFGVSFKPFSAC